MFVCVSASGHTSQSMSADHGMTLKASWSSLSILSLFAAAYARLAGYESFWELFLSLPPISV